MIRKSTVGDTSELAWFKSSYSGGNDGNSCVELAVTPGAWVDFLPYLATN